MADLADLVNVIEEEQSSSKEIAVSSLTEFEKSALKAQGIDISGPTVKVRMTPPKKIVTENPLPPPPSKEDIKKLESPADVPVVEAPVEPVPELPAYTKEDAQEYIRCVLGVLPFKKTYTTMGKNVQATFSSRTAKDNLILTTLLRDLRVRHGVGNLDIVNAAWLAFQFCYTATQVVIGGKIIEIVKCEAADYDSITSHVSSTLQKIPLPVYKALLHKLLAFEVIVSQLEAKSEDQNFWEATDA